MITEDKVKKAWQEYYDYKERHFGGPGNGGDDYRDIPDEVFKKKRELEEKARKLQKEYNESQHFVDNDVFKFRISFSYIIYFNNSHLFASINAKHAIVFASTIFPFLIISLISS